MDFKVNSNSSLSNFKSDKKTGDVSFKNGYALAPVSQFMNLAANSDAFNTTVLDMVGMVIPRTFIDSKRNEHAKLETFRREIMGTLTNCLSPGLVAFAVGVLAQPLLKMETKMLANDDTIEVLEEAWKNAEKIDGDRTKNYVKNVLNGISGLDGDKNWNKLANKINSEKADEQIVSKMVKLIENKNDKKVLKEIENSIGELIQARKTIKVSFKDSNGKDKEINTMLEHLLRDMRDMGEHIFKKFNGDELKTAIQKTKKLNNTKALTALGLIGTVDLVTQFANRRMTSKETGKKGFVGYKDYKDCNISNDDPKKKTNLLIKKGLAMVALGILAKGTIKLGPEKGLSNKLKELQFQKMFPTMNQIKILYTATVAGRFLAAEDSNEFRESVTRDFFSYINWLVLGNIVTKAIVWKNNKDLINIKQDSEYIPKDASRLEKLKSDNKKLWNWIQNTEVKTHHEVLDLVGTEKNGIKYTEEIVNKKIKSLNKATGAGLLYSTVMLGIGIPIINIFLTDKRRKEQLAALKINHCKTTIHERKYDNQLFAAFIK
jgi:hypothetical protein